VDVIVVKGLGKRFIRSNALKPVTLMEAALYGWRYVGSREFFWALQNVSFNVAKGETFGIIGNNGAGKSTLLRMLGGVVRADQGSIQVNGRIGSLYELGAGLHSDLTGRENVFLCCVAGGLLRREAASLFDDIVQFAELGEFIDSPVRTYSSGMRMRLAFSIAIHIIPQILLVDEFLSVGDRAFQQKCLNKIQQLQSQGTSIVLISHNLELIRTTCQRALWLNHGQVMDYGDASTVADSYLASV
jgi:lipopolysaccharide transport system ATP-binding protein